MRSVLVFLLLASPLVAVAQPDPVPRLVDRKLDRASYVELARQWRAYMDENGESVVGLVNLGLALDYSGEEPAALRVARRAVELDADDPRALTFLGRMLVIDTAKVDEALDVLERSRALDPDQRETLTLLVATHQRRGDFDGADAVSKVLFERGHFERPLLDFAYNLLVDLPEGAVLITSGDNDTFPVHGLQSGRGVRTDVTVLNRSLLNVPAYVEGAIARRPELAIDLDVDGFQPHYDGDVAVLLSNVVIEAVVERTDVPVHVAASAMYEQHGWMPPGTIDGITFRASGPPRPVDEVARGFVERFRLDSATDWTYPWSLRSSVAALMRNYVSAIARLVDDRALSPELRRVLFAEGLAIAEFHDFDHEAMVLEQMKQRWAKN